jgi:hypothetical protein
MVLVEELAKDSAQVSPIEHDQVIQTITVKCHAVCTRWQAVRRIKDGSELSAKLSTPLISTFLTPQIPQ